MDAKNAINGFYFAYVILLAIVVLTTSVAPLIAFHGPESLASVIYNAYVPTCHQWIYRSSCIFYDGNTHWIGDCINDSEQAKITTVYTNASKYWDGQFKYSVDQIGLNRAEKVDYFGVVGYKFANDTRNMGIYISMLFIAILLPFFWKNPRVPHPIFLILAVTPLAIDGTGQLIGFWESTNTIRFITGFLSGISISVYIYAILNRTR